MPTAPFMRSPRPSHTRRENSSVVFHVYLSFAPKVASSTPQTRPYFIPSSVCNAGTSFMLSSSTFSPPRTTTIS